MQARQAICQSHPTLSIHLQVIGKRKDMGSTYQAEYQTALGCALSAWLKPTVKTHNQDANPRGPLIFVSDYFVLWETSTGWGTGQRLKRLNSVLVMTAHSQHSIIFA